MTFAVYADIIRLALDFVVFIGFVSVQVVCVGVRNWGTDVRAKRICGFAGVLGVNDGFAALVIVCALVLLGIMGNWQFRV